MGKSEIVSEVLNRIKQRGLFDTVTRYQYPLDMDMAIEIIEQIGKMRNQKFRIDDENRFTYENLIRWCHCDTEMKCLDPDTQRVIPGGLKRGIYIAGNTGTGKSWCLEVMSAYSNAFNFNVSIGGEKRSLCWRNIRTDAICGEFTEQGTFERFKQMPIVGIQDLGAEPAESLHMGNRINVLRQILEYRGDRTDQLTLITSNLPMSHKRLIDRYDVRVASRLNEMCNYFEIKGLDRRKP